MEKTIPKIMVYWYCLEKNNNKKNRKNTIIKQNKQQKKNAEFRVKCFKAEQKS